MDNQQPSNKTEWRQVKEHQNYEVNQFGEIRHKKRQQILKPRRNPGGYLYVCFKVNGKNTNFAVHRIVANAFIPNPNEKQEVNHKDYDKTNNCVANLEWVSGSENKKHAFQKKENKDKRGKEVAQYSKNGDFIAIYPTISEAAQKTNGSIGAISNCCRGRSKTSGGFRWSFVEGSTTKYERNPSSSVQSTLKKVEDIV